MDTTADAPLRCCLVFGGASGERDISAGSIKPWITTLAGRADVSLTVIFLDPQGRGVILPERFYYTNTCADFEIALGDDDRLSESVFDEVLASAELVVPIIHGRPGEDGAFAQRLEKLGVPYLFSGPQALAASFDKGATYERLVQIGLPVPAHVVISHVEWQSDESGACDRALRALDLGADDKATESLPADTPGHKATETLAVSAPGHKATETLVVKPRGSGSSLGVSLIKPDQRALRDAIASALEHDDHALVEEFLDGTEFSLLVLDDESGRPQALAPTEIEKQAVVYDTRAKYLQGEGARLHTPMRATSMREAVREASCAAYTALGMGHMARVDGFVVGDEVYVTDVNGISGMGFSSFVFLQTAMVGASHADIVAYLIQLACGRRLSERPAATAHRRAGSGTPSSQRTPGHDKPRLHLLFGGATSERQVSRQSGIFAGLCLSSQGFDVRFVFMDRAQRFTEVGLFQALHHDVEEIEQLIADQAGHETLAAEAQRVAPGLPGLCDDPTRHLAVGPTQELAQAVAAADVVFSTLHGGVGEDGSIQAALEQCGVPYNGSGPTASRLCADKWELLERVGTLDIPGLSAPRHMLWDRSDLARLGSGCVDEQQWDTAFAAFCRSLDATALVIKPRADGCSTGVKLLRSGRDMALFVKAVVALADRIEPGSFGPDSREIKLPVPPPHWWIVEQALIGTMPESEEPTDDGRGALSDDNRDTLKRWFDSTRFVELTCGVIEELNGQLVATTPTLSMAADSELSLEEKFQQGTGTNLLLSEFVDKGVVQSLRRRIANLARSLGLAGFARIDGFYDRQNDELLIIEVNTLCAMTEATVFYTQVLDTFGWSPPEALAHIARVGMARGERPTDSTAPKCEAARPAPAHSAERPIDGTA